MRGPSRNRDPYATGRSRISHPSSALPKIKLVPVWCLDHLRNPDAVLRQWGEEQQRNLQRGTGNRFESIETENSGVGPESCLRFGPARMFLMPSGTHVQNDI